MLLRNPKIHKQCCQKSIQKSRNPYSEVHSEIHFRNPKSKQCCQKSIFVPNNVGQKSRNPSAALKQCLLKNPKIHSHSQTMLLKNPFWAHKNPHCCSKIHSANSDWVRRVFTVNKNNRRFEFNYSSEESRLHVGAPSIAAAAGTVNPDFSSTSSRFW